MIGKTSSTAKFLALFFMALLFLQGPSLLWGQAGAPPESTVRPTPSLLQWGKPLATVAIVATIALIVYAAFFRRYPFPDTNAKWMLLIGLVFAPLPLMLSGNMVGMEGTKRVEACNSCHVMHPFVNDMLKEPTKNDLKHPEKGTLAAKHFRGNYKGQWIAENQCYGCHVDYNMLGMIQGKRDGLRHALKYYTNTYQLPIQYHSGRTYNAGICLHCHGESKVFINKHLDLKTAAPTEIAELKRDCIKCHTDPTINPDWGPVHPPRSERSSEASTASNRTAAGERSSQ